MSTLDVASITAQAAGSEPPSLKHCTAMSSLRRSTKILDRHLTLIAIVYIRQSTPQQVIQHRESRERQYGLARVVVDLGWSRDHVLVIDDDQGQSGKTTTDRNGFRRVVAEVTMGHVGLVAGIELSRLVRSTKEWLNLIEICALCGTLLADEDGVYDPRDPNDRLLLGLKATISEYELVLMSNRLGKNKLNKAQRGELFQNVWIGYVKCSSDRVVRQGLSLPPAEQDTAGDSSVSRAQPGPVGVATTDVGDGLPDPASPHLCRSLRLRASTSESRRGQGRLDGERQGRALRSHDAMASPDT
jgi:DNA invertase Pin-like site-specific DNA recombinase